MLLDHFRPPLSDRRHWHSFHNAWATYISSQLNSCLPEGYFAEPNVQYGIEIDVAAFAESASALPISQWQPSKPQFTSPISITETIVEIGIFSRSGGSELAGAVELVSPANKDRPSHRDAFVSKCASCIQSGIGLVIVDVVTERTADLHRELLDRLGIADTGNSKDLYTSAYRPVELDGVKSLEVWNEVLTIGKALPTMPLWLRGGLCIPVDLQSTYHRTCVEQRVPTAA